MGFMGERVEKDLEKDLEKKKEMQDNITALVLKQRING